MKPIIFISHISEEAHIAKALKEFIEKKFLKSLDVFVSAHEESIQLGDEWISNIKISLEKSKLIIVLCSPNSIDRRWINFEAGAGWIRNIPVIPICHSGLTLDKLPKPINFFQGGLLNNQEDIKRLFNKIASLLDLDTPAVIEKEFENAINKFEAQIKISLLMKDTQFISNLLFRHISILKHSILASTINIFGENTNDYFSKNLDNHTINFNEIFNLYRPCSLLIKDPQTPIYIILKDTLIEIENNIKFLLSYSKIEISPSINELFIYFLYSINKIGNWFFFINMLNKHFTDKEPWLFDMIKNEATPPKKRDHANAINSFIEYYEGLLFYKEWIVKFEGELHLILDSKNNNQDAL